MLFIVKSEFTHNYDYCWAFMALIKKHSSKDMHNRLYNLLVMEELSFFSDNFKNCITIQNI